MKAVTTLCVLSAFLNLAAQPRDYPVKPVPFTAVHVDDGFWAPRIEITFAFGKDEETCRMDNFVRAAQALRGEPFENKKYPPYPFDDTDVSSDHASYFDWYPARGNKETVAYTFAQPAQVSECGLYWFDDTGQGSVRVPASWRLLYKDGDQWKPVETRGEFGVAKDQFNTVKFAPVTTPMLRVEVQAQPKSSMGIQKWTAR